jgi:hypothetical protein
MVLFVGDWKGGTMLFYNHLWKVVQVSLHLVI